MCYRSNSPNMLRWRTFCWWNAMLRDESIITLRKIIGVKGENHIDCLMLTFLAPPPLDEELPGNYSNSIFGNMSCSAAKSMTARRLLSTLWDSASLRHIWVCTIKTKYEHRRQAPFIHLARFHCDFPAAHQIVLVLGLGDAELSTRTGQFGL